MRIQFFIPMKLPSATHQMKKWGVWNGKPYSYEPQSVKDARQKFIAHLAKHVPDAPMQGPLSLTTQWIYPADSKHPDKTWKTTKPDTDNLVKLLKDVMTTLHFWKDDAQVASEVIQKFYSSGPTGLFVLIEPMERGK